MNLETAKNAVLSLLDLFSLSKGKKIVKESAAPIAPLIQRLGLPELPPDIKNDDERKASFVFGCFSSSSASASWYGRELSESEER